jgi:molybdopterin-guanine dinucleotide biosynthesis protein A
MVHQGVMTRAGFVLAGGKSSRMGRDKALLEWQGTTLIIRVAEAVKAAAGSVALIGDPAKYGGFGYSVYGDVFPGCGPLGGIRTALTVTRADWNLVVACDMPEVEPAFLRGLLDRAEAVGADCLLPAGESARPEPLCGVYHRRALVAIERALDAGVRKVLDGLAGVRLEVLRVGGGRQFRNINTPEEWTEYKYAQNTKTPEGDI